MNPSVKELHTNLENREEKEKFLEKTLENNDEDENTESENDSDDEMVMKFVLPKNSNGKTNVSNESRYIGLTLAQSKKIGKLKSDVTRLEDRVRYLQLDLNNAIVKKEETLELIEKYKNALRNNNKILKDSNSIIYKNSLFRIYQITVYCFTIITDYQLITSNEFIYIVDFSETLMFSMMVFYFYSDVRYIFKNTIGMRINTKQE
jgi:hypothetical protein